MKCGALVFLLGACAASTRCARSRRDRLPRLLPRAERSDDSPKRGRSLRSLQIIPGLDPHFGGPPMSALATSIALRERGLDNSLIYTDRPKDGVGARANADFLRTAGVEVRHFPVLRSRGERSVRWGISPRAAIWLARNAHHYDVLHMHGAWTFTTVIGLVAAKLHGRAAALSTHESLTDFDRAKSAFPKRIVKRALRRAWLSLFDTVIVASALEQHESGDRASKHTVVIPYAVRPIKAGMHRRTGSQLRAGFLARIDPKKNLDLLLQAVGTVPGVELVVAGDGNPRYVDALHRFADELDVSDRVTWLGFVAADAKADFLGAIDVLAVPSEYECFCIAAVEGMTRASPSS